jgi:hypothetical protein
LIGALVGFSFWRRERHRLAIVIIHLPLMIALRAGLG